MWLDNPARALGELVPGLVLGLATAGAGTAGLAGRAAGRARKLGDAAADLSRVRRVGGRLPINSRFAGKTFHLSDELAKKYPNGVRFTDDGFPDFSPYERARLEFDDLSGQNRRDALKANEALGLSDTPDAYVWHHAEDGRTRQLVPKDLHKAVRHTGGGRCNRARHEGHLYAAW